MSTRLALVVAFVACSSRPSSEPLRTKSPDSSSTPTSKPSGSSDIEPCEARSCVELGRAYEHGTHRPRDYRKATAAYRHGCDTNDALACRLLADSYLLMRGTRDIDHATPT